NLTVRIKIKLNPDGSLISSEILDQASRSSKSGQNSYKVLAESALRAVRLCNPLKVPPTGYEKWKEMQLNFDAKEMLKG
ncbi:MAG: cell envelope biogenesis protein TolA, partial [Candidatus Fonsibacter lacus]|nr:cell envelope biogenesis protein TolA [Candidatus Fonsibacter lacus]